MSYTADRDLWACSKEKPIPPPTELSYWGFACLDRPSPKFQLTVCRNGRREQAYLSDPQASMLANFDLEYWIAYTDSNISLLPAIVQTFVYIHGLRRVVENEILAENPHCASLLFWAVRSIRRMNHGNFNAAQLYKEAAYSQFPTSNRKNKQLLEGVQLLTSFIYLAEWASHFANMLRSITKDVEIYLQESCSEVRTGQHDALSFIIHELGFKDLLDVVPFKPGKVMPELLAMSRKRGLSTTTLNSISKRARNEIVKGTYIGVVVFL
jgi:hypothetical protein